MNPDKTLEAILEQLSAKSTMEEFFKVFEMAVEHLGGLKVENEQERTDLQKQLKTALEENKKRIVADCGAEWYKMWNKVNDLAGIDGKDGEQGPVGPQGPQGSIGPSGRDGKDGINGTDGVDGSPDSPDEIISKINQSKLLISKERIEGLLDALGNMVNSAVGVTTTFFLKNGTTVNRAKNINFIEGNNVTLSMYQTGDQMNVQISSSGGSGATWIDSEVPTDSGDHTNFTLAHTPVTGTVKVYRGGARQQVTVDYTLSGTTITLTNALLTGEVLVVDYGY